MKEMIVAEVKTRPKSYDEYCKRMKEIMKRSLTKEEHSVNIQFYIKGTPWEEAVEKFND